MKKYWDAASVHGIFMRASAQQQLEYAGLRPPLKAIRGTGIGSGVAEPPTFVSLEVSLPQTSKGGEKFSST